MDQSTFTALTGITLSDGDGDRFDTVSDAATAMLEQQLGYPLDPSAWSNLYNEAGKTQDECICPDVVNDDYTLDPADAVVGKYRLFTWEPEERYLPIDPATAIHAVKLVHNDVTYKTFNQDTSNEYRIQWQNGNPKVAYYLDMYQCGWNYWPQCWQRKQSVQVAVDADWAWDTIPDGLNLLWAKMIADGFKSYDYDDIQSESRGSHSYTKRDRETATQKFPELAKYAGPNGLAKRPRHT